MYERRQRRQSSPKDKGAGHLQAIRESIRNEELSVRESIIDVLNSNVFNDEKLIERACAASQKTS